MAEPTTPERRLPGTARPRTEALREYEEEVQKIRSNCPIDQRILVDIFWPSPEKLYRWRMQLDCGCIIEAFSRGDENPPTGGWTDTHRRPLPTGQVVCFEHREDRKAPYREIVEWHTSKLRDFEADPEEPEDWWGSDKDLWEKIRRKEPCTSAFWTVTYTCGHQGEVCTDVDWKPGNEPRRVTPERQAEMLAEDWPEPKTDDERLEQEHIDRMIRQGWPRPFPEHQCYTCLSARTIVAYQRVGWLVPPPKPVAPPTPEQVAELESKAAQQRARRIKKLEAELAQLKAETP